jgi:DNA-binding NarL/FixJ family response regulator
VGAVIEDRTVDDPLASVRVVVVDPRAERRAITKLFVDHSPRLTVVGEAATRAEAEELVHAQQASVAVIEIQMPLTEGLDTIAALHDRFPALRIIVCSFRHDAMTREAARQCGADIFLTKPIQYDELAAAAAPAPVEPEPSVT